MTVLKVTLYMLTGALAMFFAFQELRMKKRLTDESITPVKNVSDFGVSEGLRTQMERESILKSLPKLERRGYDLAVKLKFVFIVLLVGEVLVMQR